MGGFSANMVGLSGANAVYAEIYVRATQALNDELSLSLAARIAVGDVESDPAAVQPRVKTCRAARQDRGAVSRLRSWYS